MAIEGKRVDIEGIKNPHNKGFVEPSRKAVWWLAKPENKAIRDVFVSKFTDDDYMTAICRALGDKAWRDLDDVFSDFNMPTSGATRSICFLVIHDFLMDEE